MMMLVVLLMVLFMMFLMMLAMMMVTSVKVIIIAVLYSSVGMNRATRSNCSCHYQTDYSAEYATGDEFCFHRLYSLL